MPRKKRQKIKTSSNESLESLLQETYNDACVNIIDAQRTINEMVNSAEPEDVDDLTKIAKEKTNALKIKDSAIKIKLEIAKLQNDILKHSGDTNKALEERTSGKVSLNDFKAIRKMIEDTSKNNEES